MKTIYNGRSPTTYDLTLKGNRQSKYRRTGANELHYPCHMIKTEAQTLDEALDLIRARKRYRSRGTVKVANLVEKGLGSRPKPPITLAKLNW